METSLYLMFFDTPVRPKNKSLIIRKLKQFGATRIGKGAVEDSIEFRLPDLFNSDHTWQSFLVESACNLERSTLPC
jgi:hypothetical protein